MVHARKHLGNDEYQRSKEAENLVENFRVEYDRRIYVIKEQITGLGDLRRRKKG